MPNKTKSSTKAYADDAPLTKSELKTARRLKNADPALIAAIRRSRGRPAGRTKESVHLSLDTDIIHSLRQSGKGWQTRVNDLLRVATGLLN